jgi:hypothetical protein
MTRMWTRILRGSLWVLLLLTAISASDSLVVGLTFGSALWSASDPAPTVLWLATLALPIIIAVVLRNDQRSIRRIAASAGACWGFAAWYLLSVLQ